MRRFRNALARAIAPDVRVAVEETLAARALVAPGVLADLARTVAETSAAMRPMITVAEEVPAMRDGIAGFMNASSRCSWCRPRSSSSSQCASSTFADPYRAFLARREAVARDLRALAERHRDGYEGKSDVLSLLLSARDEDGRPMPPGGEVSDQLITMLLAGHETTATALSWGRRQARAANRLRPV